MYYGYHEIIELKSPWNVKSQTNTVHYDFIFYIHLNYSNGMRKVQMIQNGKDNKNHLVCSFKMQSEHTLGEKCTLQIYNLPLTSLSVQLCWVFWNLIYMELGGKVSDLLTHSSELRESVFGWLVYNKRCLPWINRSLWNV